MSDQRASGASRSSRSGRSSLTDGPGEKTGAPGRPGRADREEFLARPWIGVFSVPSDDARPPATLPTWYGYEPGGTLTVVTRAGRRKSRLIRRARVSLSVQRTEVPYRYVTVEGTVIRQGPASEDDLLRIGRRYVPADRVDEWLAWELGGTHPHGVPEVVEIRPDRWLTGDFS